MTKKFLIALAISTFLVIYLIKFNIGFGYESMWFAIAAIFAAISFFFFENGDDKKGKIVAIVSATIFGLVLGIKIVVSPVFFSESFVNLVKVEDVNTTGFNTKEEDVRRMSMQMAFSLSNQLLSKKVKFEDGVTRTLSSSYEMDKSAAAVQEINGELMIVIPIDYSGFFKYMSNDYIPGYIKISATNPVAKAELVLGKKIRVSKNGFFNGSIDRLAWERSGLSQTISHFEVDDEGNPFYISAVISPEMGFNADKVNYILVTDAQTGKSEKVSLDKVNELYPWIDRVWPEYIIEERINYYSTLQNGWLSKMTTGVNVSVPTQYKGSELTLVKANGKLNWFTGMTSVNSNDSALTYAVIVEANGNSQKPILHKMEMDMIFDESSAIEGIEADLGADVKAWKAILPQPYLVDGHFYWTGIIVSRNGQSKFIKKAYIDGSDKSNVSFHSIKRGNPQVGGEIDTKESLTRELLKKLDEVYEIREKLRNLQ